MQTQRAMAWNVAGVDPGGALVAAGFAAAAKMRVAMVSETWPPEINGVALTVAGLAEALRQLGHHVQVVRPRQPGETAGDGPALEQLLVPGAPLPRYRALRFGWPVYFRLLRAWRQQRPDAVYIATEGPLGWAALLAARRLGIGIASGFHTRFDDFVAHYGLGFLRRPAFAYLRAFHNRASATLVPTTGLRRELQAGGFRDVRILERGVDTAAFAPCWRSAELRRRWGLREGELAVLFVGRIAPEKNLDLAVATFRAIQARAIPARMVWVGDGPARAALAAAHPEHIFCGMLRGRELSEHYASADLFLFPSLTETFGNVTLEALASGVPLVAFDYGAAGQHLHDGIHGRVVAFGDAGAFVEASTELAGDVGLRLRISEAARRRAEELAPGAVAASFVTILRSLAAGRSP